MPIATNRQAARERFAALLARPESQLDVAETALWIEAEGDPSCDVAAALGRLAELAARAAPHLDSTDTGTRAAHLLRFLHDEAGLRGNDADYYDPRNSHLSAVLARGLGIPITLSIVYVDVAKRLGLDAAGVGFPGHFLARVVGADGDVSIVDAFHGRLLAASDLRALLTRAAGPAAELHPALLAPTPPREIIARVLRNLKHAHAQRGEVESALACSERLLLLAPDDADERRDAAALRGLLRRVN